MHIASWLFVLHLQTIAPDPCLMNALAQVLHRGDGIAGRVEAAAFLVREADGSLRIKVWPHREVSRRATFLGAIPPGTIAIAHTHPPHLPEPSPQDVREAVRLKLPIYVLTVREIWIADPASEQATRIGGRRLWSGEALRSACRPPSAVIARQVTPADPRRR